MRAWGRSSQALLDRLDELAFRLRVTPAGDALLETRGQRTGEPRVTPVSDGEVGDTFWIIAQRGRRSGYVRNIEANPRVRVKGRGGWRTGTAHLLDDDDPRERQRILGRRDLARRLCLRASSAFSTSPLTVRIDLRPVDGADGEGAGS